MYANQMHVCMEVFFAYKKYMYLSISFHFFNHLYTCLISEKIKIIVIGKLKRQRIWKKHAFKFPNLFLHIVNTVLDTVVRMSDRHCLCVSLLGESILRAGNVFQYITKSI